MKRNLMLAVALASLAAASELQYGRLPELEGKIKDEEARLAEIGDHV